MASHAEFTRQYNLSYTTRLGKVKELIMSNPAISEYNLPLRRLNESLMSECIVIAILVLDSKLKSSILQASGHEDPKNGREDPKSYIPGGTYNLEDNCGKIPILFSSSFNKLFLLSTGTVLGFVGRKNDKNTFICSDVIFPKPVMGCLKDAVQGGMQATGKVQTTDKMQVMGKVQATGGAVKDVDSAGTVSVPAAGDATPTAETASDAIALLVSNPLLNCGGYTKFKILIDYFSRKVSTTVLIGDIYTDGRGKPDLEDFNSIFKGLPMGKAILVPGPNDPTTSVLPQRPFHELLFDREIRSLINLPHPAQEVVCGKRVVLMNNSILRDLRKYIVDETNRGVVYGEMPGGTNSGDVPNGETIPDAAVTDADLLEQLLKIRLIAPNCPDTMAAMPLAEHDPFVIGDCDYLICGGCAKFETRRVNETEIVCVPSFSGTQSAVVGDFAAGKFTEVTVRT